MVLLFPALFLRYNVFNCFSLKETENLLNIGCKIKIYFTCDHRKYDLKLIYILNQHSTNILYIFNFDILFFFKHQLKNVKFHNKVLNKVSILF